MHNYREQVKCVLTVWSSC